MWETMKRYQRYFFKVHHKMYIGTAEEQQYLKIGKI